MSAWGKMHMRNRKWTDLPTDLVSYIADRLGIIELLSFRSVCKAWNSASSSASAKMESKPDFEPWFLLYGSDDECQLITESGEKYTMCLPQMDGTTCIASNHGWLLLFQQGGSMFFFRPFSRTKIDLPKFPASELSGHVAAFSSPPNSQDCTVCVVSRSNDEELELSLLHRGANEWIQVQHKHERHINTIKCASYYREQFYFFDDRNKMLIFRTEDLSWKHRWLVSGADKEKSPAQFYYRSAHWKSNDIKKLGLEEDASISTCGTQSQYHGIGFFVFNETITGKQVEGSESRQYKGVWIYPRICQTAPKDESW